MVKVARHWWKGLRFWAIQVPKREASPMRVWQPLGLRVPPLILRATTSGRTLRSAKLLWAGTPGTATKTNNSGKKRSTRSHNVCWGARVRTKGWQSCQCCSSHEVRNEVVMSSKPGEKYASLRKKKELVPHKGGIYEQYRRYDGNYPNFS